MAKNPLPDFVPELRVVANGSASHRLVLVFDTATDLDLLRSPRIVMVDTEGVTSITTSVEDLAVEETLLRQFATGKIQLVTQKGAAEGSKYLLADFKILIEAVGKPDKGGKMNFPPASEIEQLIRQGVADAFSEASIDMIHNDQSAAATSSPSSLVDQGPSRSAAAWGPRLAMAQQGVGHGSGATRGSAGSRAHMSKKMMAALALLALLLVVAIFKIATASNDPVQVAVNKALANDPRARDEQIEITRSTLKEMGLDPGKNGDLGCLAAQ